MRNEFNSQSLREFRENAAAAGFIVGNSVALRSSGTATSESQYEVRIHREGMLVVEKGSLRGGDGLVQQASGDFGYCHPWFGNISQGRPNPGYIFHPLNHLVRTIVGEPFVTQSIRHPNNENDKDVVYYNVKPVKIGGVHVVDLGNLHKLWEPRSDMTPDPERRDTRRNTLYALPGSWEAFEYHSRLSLSLDITGPFRSFLGGAPFLWQKYTGDGLVVLTSPHTRISRRVLMPGEVYEYMDIRNLFGISAGGRYRASFTPVKHFTRGNPYFTVTAEGPLLLLEKQ